MLGQPSRHAVPAAAAPRRPGGAAVGLTSVTVPGRLREVSLTAAGGEIVGLAGLQGSGHLAALDAVRGRVRPASGTVRLPGGGSPRSPRHAVTEGVAELVELCDRVVVLRHGRIVDALDGDRLTEPELSLAVNAGFADPL